MGDGAQSKQLSPADRKRILTVYAKTANASETARQCGVSDKTVRNVIARAGGPKKSEIHARATEEGIRAGRRALKMCTKVVSNYLSQALDPDTLALEPGDAARLIQAQTQIVKATLDVQERLERKRNGRLTREKTKAEIKLTQARTLALQGLGDWLANATDEELALIEKTLAPIRARKIRSADSSAEREESPDGNEP